VPADQHHLLDPELPIGLADGVGLVVAIVGMAFLSWAGPPLVEFLVELAYNHATGDQSNIESPFAELFAPDIYVTSATGGPVPVQLSLRTAGASDVSPAWNAGSWNVVPSRTGR
jgi:hypothetical protein